jgi:sodium-dependent dicarboxylate transporter 2/3/5
MTPSFPATLPRADADQTPPWVRRLGLGLGVGFFLLTFLIAPPEGMTPAGWRVCGLALWMATWWITEAVSLPVTALLPLTVLPLGGLMSFRKVAANFSADLIFLFLGGFVLSIAIQKWRVHERLGLGLLRHVSSSAPKLIGGLILVTGFLGMWMSNAATAMVMMPMALSIAALVNREGEGHPALAKALVFAVAYAPCIGGLSTFIGTPTNAVLNGYLTKTYGVHLSLAEWMSFGVPIAAILLIACWALLYFSLLRGSPALPGLGAVMHREYQKLGAFSAGEKATTAVFALCVTAWVLSDFWEGLLGVPFDDAVIALVGALLLFLIPLDRKFDRTVLSWSDTVKLPWGILLFFGGSLSLAAALAETGVTTWLSQEMTILHHVPVWLVAIAVVALVVILSEMMSNSATVLAVLPILTGLSGALGINPLLLMIPATMAASCAFMMPGASPTNAIAYATGALKVPDMVRLGLRINAICAAVLLLAAFYFVPKMLTFDPFTAPAWSLTPTPGK